MALLAASKLPGESQKPSRHPHTGDNLGWKEVGQAWIDETPIVIPVSTRSCLTLSDPGCPVWEPPAPWAIVHLKCDWSKMRCVISVRYSDFKDFI